MSETYRIAIVAGEQSGDLAGGALLKSLEQRIDFEAVGIGGDTMQAAGLKSLFSMDALAVTGVWEVLARLPKLLKLRRQLIQKILDFKPDIFIGIDAPDFNFGIEKVLRAKGIQTVHYHSPSVWAWRKGRLKGIKQSTSHMLVQFPFEVPFYEEAQIPVTYTGHPFADDIPMEIDVAAARTQLNLPLATTLVAVLPGSRMNEVTRLGPLFIDTMQRCYQQAPHLSFIIPAANTQCFQHLQKLLAACDNLPVQLVQGQSRQCLMASNAVLTCCGTAALEAMLCKKPMVVGYVLSKWTALLVRGMMHSPHYALPNLLTAQAYVPEFIQEAATPGALSEALLATLAQDNKQLVEAFTDCHQLLRGGGAETSAQVITQLLN